MARRKGEGRYFKQVGTSVTEEMYQLISEEVEKTKATIAEVLRAALRKYYGLEQVKKFLILVDPIEARQLEEQGYDIVTEG